VNNDSLANSADFRLKLRNKNGRLDIKWILSVINEHQCQRSMQKVLKICANSSVQRSSESSGMYCRVLNCMSTDVWEVRAASIIRAMSLWASYSPPWELEISQLCAMWTALLNRLQCVLVTVRTWLQIHQQLPVVSQGFRTLLSKYFSWILLSWWETTFETIITETHVHRRWGFCGCHSQPSQKDLRTWNSGSAYCFVSPLPIL
jgi:hypothetical protein